MIKQLGRRRLRNVLPPRTLREGRGIIVAVIIIIFRENLQWAGCAPCPDRAGWGFDLFKLFLHLSCIVRRYFKGCPEIFETDKAPKAAL